MPFQGISGDFLGQLYPSSVDVAHSIKKKKKLDIHTVKFLSGASQILLLTCSVVSGVEVAFEFWKHYWLI